MSKATVTRLFIGAGLAMIAGAVLAFVAAGIAIANNVFVMNGPDIVGLRGGALGVVIARAGPRRRPSVHRRPDRRPCRVDRSPAESLAA